MDGIEKLLVFLDWTQLFLRKLFLNLSCLGRWYRLSIGNNLIRHQFVKRDDLIF